MLPSFLGVYMYRSGCCITRWNGWIVTDFGNSTPQAAHLFALFSSFRKCTSNSSSLWNGSVNIGTDEEITGLVWGSFFPFLDFFCFTCFSWSSSVLRDTFYFLYILLQSSLNFTGSHNVFTKNFKLCSDICYYMYQHMYKITNPVFSFPCTMYTFSGQSTHVLLPDSLVNIDLSAARTPALLQTSLSLWAL